MRFSFARRASRVFAPVTAVAFLALVADAGCGRTTLDNELVPFDSGPGGAQPDGGTQTPDATVPDSGADAKGDGKRADAPPALDSPIGTPDVRRPVDAPTPPEDARRVFDHIIDVPGNDTGTCGDGKCDNGETCTTCPEDCGFCASCGDGTCGSGETCSSCPVDCGACDSCGDGFCDSGETCTTCPQDCGQCASCGDGKCESNENCNNCPQDCGNCAGCPSGHCGGTETCISCPEDCGECAVCGNGVCQASEGETCNNCPADCGACTIATTCAAILMCAESGIQNDISSGNFGAALTALSDCDANACANAEFFAGQAVTCIVDQFLPPTGTCSLGGGGGGGGFTCALNGCSTQISDCIAQAPCPTTGG